MSPWRPKEASSLVHQENFGFFFAVSCPRARAALGLVYVLLRAPRRWIRFGAETLAAALRPRPISLYLLANELFRHVQESEKTTLLGGGANADM